MESMPQLVVQLCLWEAKLIPLNWIFWTTSLSSIRTCSWAFTKLLKVGPCQILPKRKYGFGFLMVLLSVLSAIALKVYVLLKGIAFSPNQRWIQISIWMSLCLLLPLVLVIKTKYLCLLSAPLSPDRRQVERPPPSIQITSIFLVFYGLSHGTTLKKKGVAVF